MLYHPKFDTLFLDRDGVINLKIDHSYVLTEKDIVILPGMPAFIAWAKKNFRQVLVITNQQCVGKGLISFSALEKLNKLINEKTGGLIDDFFVCPHLVQDCCDCRKPKEQLFLQASQKNQVNFSNSWMIGDSETDIIPAKKLGIKTVFISPHPNALADVNVPDTLALLTNSEKIFASA